MTVVAAAVDRCGGRDGRGVPDSLDRGLEPKDPDLTWKEEQELAVRALVVRHAQMIPQA